MLENMREFLSEEKKFYFIKSAAESIEKNIKNKCLYDCIMSAFNETLGDNNSSIMADESHLTIVKSDVNIFSISFIPSIEQFDTICITQTVLGGGISQEIRAEFLDDTVTVTEKTLARYRDQDSTDYCSILKKSTKKTYINNQLRYSYELSNLVAFNFKTNKDCSTFSEMYVDEKGTAVKKQVTIDEEDFAANRARYFEIECCGEAPFNDREDNGVGRQYGMSSTTEEVFNSFAKEQKEILRKKLQN